MTKDELRHKLKIKRKYFGEVLRGYADECICENFLNAYSDLDSFFIYNSYSTEADTRGIIRALLNKGKRVCLPRVEGDKIVAVPYTADTEMKKSALGIYEPCGQAYEGQIQVTVAPLLAVNSRGYRLGCGGGYYDRYFKGVQTLKVGIGYSFQQEEFEEQSFDMGLDCFISERGIYYFGKRV